MIKVLV